MDNNSDFFYLTDRSFNHYTLLWDEHERWLRFEYYVYFLEHETDKHLSYFHNGIHVPLIKDFNPFFREWVKFLEAEFPDMEFKDRFGYVNANRKKVALQEMLNNINNENTFSTLLKKFSTIELTYLNNEAIIDNERVKQRRYSVNLDIDYSKDFSLDAVLEDYNRNDKEPDFRIILLFLMLNSKETSKYKGIPFESLATFLMNLDAIAESQDAQEKDSTNKNSKSENPLNFELMISGELREKILMKLYEATTKTKYELSRSIQCTICDSQTSYATFKQIFTEFDRKVDMPLKILVSIYFKSKKSLVSAILYLFKRMGDELIINPEHTESDKGFYARLRHNFVDRNGDPLKCDSLKNAKSKLGVEMVGAKQKEWGKIIDSIIDDLVRIISEHNKAQGHMK